MRIIYILLLCICITPVLSQTKASDSLTTLLAKEKIDTVKARLMLNLASVYTTTEPDRSLKLIYQAWKIADQTGYEPLIMRCKLSAGYIMGFTGNYVKALQLTLEGKAIAEKLNIQWALTGSYHQLGNIYKWQKNFRLSAIQYHQALQYAGTGPYLPQLNLGIVYLELGQVDSALQYAQQSYQLILKDPGKTYLAAVLGNLGRIHQQLGNRVLGRNYLSMAEEEAARRGSMRSRGFIWLDLSAFFQFEKNTDSAIHYSKRIINTPGMNQFKPVMLDAAQNLSDFYTNRNTDSAFKYLKLATALKEELVGAEKTQQMLTMRYEEELRQQQMATTKIKEAEDRKNNLQYAAIAIALVVFVILFFVFSHSIMANQKLIKFLGVIALLIVFEFLNLLLHPWLGAVTHHSPVLMLLAMVCVAALLIPLHHKLEHWITHRLVEKNKKIRVAAAKKIIAQLEPENAN